jgi:hypothetical protein
MGTSWSQSLKVDCASNIHPWTKSCLVAAVNNPESLRESLKVYTSLYTISAILSGKGVDYMRTKLWKEIIRSSLFLSSHGCFFCAYICLFRKLLGTFRVLSLGLLPGFCSAFTCILIERKSRRGVLAMYMLNLASETLFKILKDSEYVNDVPYGEVVMFCVATAILMAMYNTNTLPQGFVKTLLDKCFRRKNSAHDDNTTHQDKPEEPDLVAMFKNSALLGGQVFGASWFLHTTYSLVNSIVKIFRKPSTLLSVVRRKDNIRFAAWLSSFVFIYRNMLALLNNYTKSARNTSGAVAGAVAGLSIMFHRKTSYALYVLSKTVELLYTRGMEEGVVPYFKHFDTLLYSCSTAVMLHSLILQPQLMKSQYFTFLDQLSGHKFSQVKRSPLDVFGMESSQVQTNVPNPWIGVKALSAHSKRTLHNLPTAEE